MGATLPQSEYRAHWPEVQARLGSRAARCARMRRDCALDAGGDRAQALDQLGRLMDLVGLGDHRDPHRQPVQVVVGVRSSQRCSSSGVTSLPVAPTLSSAAGHSTVTRAS